MEPPGPSNEERRLAELLVESGALTGEAARDCLDLLGRLRGAGRRVHLAAFLVERELVSPELLRSLGAGRQLGPSGERDDETARVDVRPRPRRRRSSARASLAPVDPEASGGGGERPALPAGGAASGGDSSVLGEVETRRFDLDALAAASAVSAEEGAQRPLGPLLGGLATVLLVGLFGWLASIQPPPRGARASGAGEGGSAVPSSAGGANAAANDGEGIGGGPVARGAEADDAGRGEAESALGEVVAAVERLEAAGEYSSAIELLAGLSPQAREAGRDRVAALEARLARLRSFAEETQRRIEAARGLRHTKELEEGVRALEAFRAEHASLVDAPPMRMLDEALRDLRARLAEQQSQVRLDGEEDPKAASLRPEPPERVASFARLAERGRRRVEELRRAIAAEEARLARLEGEELRRARAASRRSPLDVELLGGFAVRGAILRNWTERGFTLEAEGRAYTYAWSAVEPELALRVRRLGVRGEVAEDHLRLGRWCLEQRLFDEARAAFGRAVALDPRLRDQVPDISGLARSARLFAGRVRREGALLSVRYDFRDTGEGADWELMPRAGGGVNPAAGRFVVRGTGIALATLREVGFVGRVQIEAALGPLRSGSSAVLGISLGVAGRAEVRYLAAVDPTRGEALLAEHQRGEVRVLERRKGLGRRAKRVVLDLTPERVAVKIDRRVVFRVAVDRSWERSRIHVGVAADGPGSAAFERVVVRGRVRREWLRKAFGAFDARLRAALAASERNRVFARTGAEPPAEPLSAEDDYGLAAADRDSRAAYTLGCLKATRGTPLALLSALEAFDEALKASPNFAAARYRRALVLEALGRPQKALEELGRAIASCPRFYEAYAERARLLARRERLPEARAAAEAALGHRPDYAPARSAKALVLFLAGDQRGALAELDLALALAPWDDAIRSFRRNVRHVVRGPPWERSFERATEHYVVRTDISAERCAEYARELEGIRSFYVRQFGASADPRRAVVLIFDTEEGFRSYAELTTDDRVESLLGYYLPRYRQLLLYEDRNDATRTETRRVLYHEAFHQFIDGLAPDLPAWLDEGFADYYSACRVEAGRVVGVGSVLPARLRDLRRLLRRGGGPVPFPRLMLQSSAEFPQGAASAKYAQAWSMVHFFLHGAKPALRRRFGDYVARLLAGQDARKAFEGSWEGVNWEAVQGQWRRHVDGF
ncbi:MAG: DUF1570 domain-containing protein [Planctomycetota bacterium]|nr:MAG: DUF1570 domain-containing protein [Planctomycetota bacterium]